MKIVARRTLPALIAMLLVGLIAGLLGVSARTERAVAAPPPGESAAASYVVLAWNDLGMHCYNPKFRDIGVLPPYNNLWAQVIRRGDPPQIVTTGVRVEFTFPDNTYSVGKTDFWDTSPYRTMQNAQWLFNLPQPLPDNVGLTGVGLSGDMERKGDYFVAEGIPLTEYRDSAPAVRYPFQLAEVVAYDQASGQELARATVVAPVSTEMNCDDCHYDNGPGNEGIASGSVDQNILLKHDEEKQGDYPPGLQGPLMNRRPVLCAWCHSSNALAAPGKPGIPSLSRAMHDKHADEGVPSTLAGCYKCHPGPQTKCLRGVMATQYGLECQDCHGSLQQVAQNPNPWLTEPRCDSAACHGSQYRQDQPLYRLSKDHGGVYCEGCHDSTHAIAPSAEANDAIKFTGWQGHNGPVDTCTVCHETWPAGPGPHGTTVFASLQACKTDTEGDPIQGWELSVAGEAKLTGADGCAAFDLPGPGPYTVTEEGRTGWTSVGPTIYQFTAEQGGTYQYTFVNFQHASLQACKTGSGGAPIQGWQISLGDQTKTTAANGCAFFALTVPGTYTVTEETRPGWTPIGPTTYHLTAESGGSYQVTFVNIQGSPKFLYLPVVLRGR